MVPAFDRQFILKIFEGFSIERWNDLVRPFDLIEMDKTAEKTVLAYIIGKIEESNGSIIDWNRIIYGSFFDLLRKIALCDIKAPVQRMIQVEYPEEYVKLNEWVIEQFRGCMPDSRLLGEFSEYLLEPTEQSDVTWRVLRAAHKFATLREVEMLRVVNEPFRLIEIERGLNEDIGKYLDLKGLQLLVTKQKAYGFLMQIERLRFQTRWNQTPRVPKTSVLGHSYFVAALSLLMSRSLGLDATRSYGNFFSGLFHDLPEAVTRDIISPVKQATRELPHIVKKIEDRIVRDELTPLMDDSFRDELLYFTNDEFENRILGPDGNSIRVDYRQLGDKYGSPVHKPVDGKLVRLADHIAAYVEADSSIHYGITSKHLRDGKQNILSLYPEGTEINGIDAAGFFWRD